MRGYRNISCAFRVKSDAPNWHPLQKASHLSAMASSAPFLNSSCIRSGLPMATAQCSEVRPVVSRLLGSAPDLLRAADAEGMGWRVRGWEGVSVAALNLTALQWGAMLIQHWFPGSQCIDLCLLGGAPDGVSTHFRSVDTTSLEVFSPAPSPTAR